MYPVARERLILVETYDLKIMQFYIHIMRVIFFLRLENLFQFDILFHSRLTSTSKRLDFVPVIPLSLISKILIIKTNFIQDGSRSRLSNIYIFHRYRHRDDDGKSKPIFGAKQVVGSRRSVFGGFAKGAQVRLLFYSCNLIL